MQAACGRGLAGKVLSRAYAGSHTEYHVHTRLGILLILRSREHAGWVAGSPVSLFLEAHHVSVLPSAHPAMPAGP